MKIDISDAIKELDNIRENIKPEDGDGSERTEHALWMGIVALQKGVPMRPDKYADTNTLVCPKCKRAVGYYGVWVRNYCDRCGQALMRTFGDVRERCDDRVEC